MSVLEHAVTVDVWPCLAVMHSDNRILYYKSTGKKEAGLFNKKEKEKEKKKTKKTPLLCN